MSSGERIINRLHRDMQRQHNITVVTYGDSWTYGSVAEGWYEARAAGGDSSRIHGSWSLQLRDRLVRLNREARFHNKGMPGWKAGQGNLTYEQNVASHKPDYLVLNFGINDWKNGVRLPDYQSAMEQMIGKAEAAGCGVILWTSGPLSVRSGETYGWSSPVDDTSFAHAFAEFNETLHRLAVRHDVPIADAAYEIEQLHRSGTDISGWFYDGIHFLQPGHNCILQSILRTLRLDVLVEQQA